MRYREHGQTVTLHPTDRCLILKSPNTSIPHTDHVGLSEWPHLSKQRDLGELTTTVTDEQVMTARQRSGGQLTLWKGQLKVDGVRDPDRDLALRRLGSWSWQNAPVTRLTDLDATIRICRIHRVLIPEMLPDLETVKNVAHWCSALEQRLRERQHWLPAVTSGLFQQMILSLWMKSAPTEHLHLAAEVLIRALTAHDYSRIFAGLDENVTDTLSERLLTDLGLTWQLQLVTINAATERVS